MFTDKYLRVRVEDVNTLFTNQEIKDQLIEVCRWHGKWDGENQEFEKWVKYFIKDKEIYFHYDKVTKENHGWEVNLKNGKAFGSFNELGGLEVLNEI